MLSMNVFTSWNEQYFCVSKSDIIHPVYFMVSWEFHGKNTSQI